MAQRYDLRSVAMVQSKSVFVDANVLIYLFWPTGSHKWNHYERNYVNAFRALLRQGNLLCVDVFVISEIINRVIRIEHAKSGTLGNFKDFRNSQEGQEALSDIFLIVKEQILPTFRIVGKTYSTTDIEKLLVVNELDFADKTIVEVCKDNSFVLLTNDRDFKNVDLDILTGNHNLLN
jgi:predicted nucleic acid-binding protein